MKRNAGKGVTLVEAAVVVIIIAVLAGMAVPSLRGLLDRQALRGGADELRTDLQHLRAASIARGETLWFATQASTAGSCYVIHSGSSGDCRCDAGGHATCTGDAQALKAVGFRADGRLQLQSTASALAFDPWRGTLTPTATLKLIGPHGEAVHQVMNVLARARTCSPGGSVGGYAAC